MRYKIERIGSYVCAIVNIVLWAMLSIGIVIHFAHARTAGYPLTLDFWMQNQVVREATLYQCRRRGPGDELVYIYCGVASRAALLTAQRTTVQPNYRQYQQPNAYQPRSFFSWLGLH